MSIMDTGGFINGDRYRLVRLRNPKKLGGVPTVRDFRVFADTVVENHDDGLLDDEIAWQFSLPLEDIRTVLAYADQVRRAHAHISR